MGDKYRVSEKLADDSCTIEEVPQASEADGDKALVPPVRAKWKPNLVKVLVIFCAVVVPSLISISIYYSIKLNHTEQELNEKKQELEKLRNANSILTMNNSALLEAQDTLQSQSERNNSDLQSERDTNCSGLQESRDTLQSQYVTLNEKHDEVSKEFSDLKEFYCHTTNMSSENICPVCKLNWLIFGSKCYFISTNQLTWNESHDWCKTRGGQLVNIESLEEQDFLKSKGDIGGGNVEYWIGQYDITKENTTTMMDDGPVKSDRARDVDKDKCLLIWQGLTQVFSHDCEMDCQWICESAVLLLRI